MLKDLNWISSPWPTLELPRRTLGKHSNDPLFPREYQYNVVSYSSIHQRTSLVESIEVGHRWFDRVPSSEDLSYVE